jgi:hypothetical protein
MCFTEPVAPLDPERFYKERLQRRKYRKAAEVIDTRMRLEERPRCRTNLLGTVRQLLGKFFQSEEGLFSEEEFYTVLIKLSMIDKQSLLKFPRRQ